MNLNEAPVSLKQYVALVAINNILTKYSIDASYHAVHNISDPIVRDHMIEHYTFVQKCASDSNASLMCLSKEFISRECSVQELDNSVRDLIIFIEKNIGL